MRQMWKLSNQSAFSKLRFSSLDTGNEYYSLGSRFSRPASRLVFADFDIHQKLHEFIMGGDLHGRCVEAPVIGNEHDLKVSFGSVGPRAGSDPDCAHQLRHLQEFLGISQPAKGRVRNFKLNLPTDYPCG